MLKANRTGPTRKLLTVALSTWAAWLFGSIASADSNYNKPDDFADGAFEAFGLSQRNPVTAYNENAGISYRRPGLEPTLDIPFMKRRSEREPPSNFHFGPFYLDLVSWDNALLLSNNAEQSKNNPESEAIAASTLNMNIYTEISDVLNFNLSGALVWLPFANRIGVSGFGLLAPSLRLEPFFDATLDYRNTFGEWDFEFVNEVKVDTKEQFYSTYPATKPEIWEPLQFESIDRAGNYSLGRNTTGGEPFADTLGETEITTDALRFTNLTGGTLSRMVPTQSVLSVSVYHKEYAYTDTQPSDPHYEDGLMLKLVNERKDMRFKPFGIYKFSRTNIQERTETAEVGFKGDMSDYTRITASGGVFKQKQRGTGQINTKKIYRLAITNDLTPTITQAFGVVRSPQEISTDSVKTSWFYELYKIINGNLDYALRYEKGKLDNLTFDLLDNNDSIFRQRLTYDMSERGSITVGHVVQSINYDQRPASNTNKSQVTVSYNRYVSKDTTFTTSYRYVKSDAGLDINTYTESLLFFNLRTKL